MIHETLLRNHQTPEPIMSLSREQLHDELLVLHAQGGDRDAFEQLAQRWYERLWRHAYRLTGDRESAGDVLQEAWLSITRSLPGLDDASRFRS